MKANAVHILSNAGKLIQLEYGELAWSHGLANCCEAIIDWNVNKPMHILIYIHLTYAGTHAAAFIVSQCKVQYAV